MRTVLVTGASSGIGFAAVERFLENGDRVIAHVRENLGELDGLEICDALRIVRADFSDIGAIMEMASDQNLLTVDILINNAGTYCFRDTFEEIQGEEVENLMRVNVIAPLMLCQTVIPGMVERRWGRILNVSSVSVSHGGASRSVDYTFSKAALESMTKTMAKHLAVNNVLINAIRVGVTDTKMHELNPTKDLEDRISTIPIGRMADRNEIVDMMLFLCSEQSSFISGTVVEVTGGEK